MKKALALLCALLLVIAAAAAEETVSSRVIRIENESQLPEGWTEQELLRVTVIDMQRSDAILLQCGGENMLMDGGLGLFYKRLFNVLDGLGVSQYKYLWSTHCDGDHSEGLKCLMNSDQYTGGALLSANPESYNDKYGHHQNMVRAASRHGWSYMQISDGDVFTLGGATLTTQRCNEMWGQNNRSATAFVDFGDCSIYLAADIGKRTQDRFLETVDAQRLDCDILKVPHHGMDGVNKPFIDAISPEALVITNYTGNSANKGWNAYQPYWAGDGSVVMETNGQVWYIWQLENLSDTE